MARYKVPKGVVHNVGHSFTSLMNYAGDDYVLGHLLRFVRRTGVETLTIDFVKEVAGPPELLAEPIGELPVWYTKMFWHLVESSGSDRSLVKSATLVFRYHLSIQRPHPKAPQFLASPYKCDVRITDTRGKDYAAHFDGWWCPDRLEHSNGILRPWWKFWARKNE
jgi:hypothetical protein